MATFVYLIQDRDRKCKGEEGTKIRLHKQQ